MRFLAVECLADVGLVRERMAQRRSAVWTASDGRWEVYEAQVARAEPPDELADDEKIAIDGRWPLEEQLDRLEARLSE